MSYADKHRKPPISCARCGATTVDYKPVVIQNSPRWVCRKECDNDTTANIR